MDIRQQILDKAREAGASLAGIASVEHIRQAPAHQVFPRLKDYSGVGTPADGTTGTGEEDWPGQARSALVIALEHPESRPELDWWDGKGTPGNRALMEIVKKVRPWIEEELDIRTHRLHYFVQKGGVFLKDAAVLAGLGCLGQSNLLVTPEFGPRVRLRALFLEAELEPTGPIDFDPCPDCDQLCRQVCPEQAMDSFVPAFDAFSGLSLPARDGTYDRDVCNVRMEKDMAASKALSGQESPVIKYCRECEFACPVGG